MKDAHERLRQLSDAILSRKLVAFRYGEHDRLVQPHSVGLTRKNNLLLRAYQVGGGSSSGSTPAWKLFKLEKLEGLETLDRAFTRPAPGYNPNDHILTKMIAQVGVPL